jgi:hypothetical protein
MHHLATPAKGAFTASGLMHPTSPRLLALRPGEADNPCGTGLGERTTMKLITLITAGFALALAPAAHAQITCVELTLVLQSGLTNFEQLKGAPAEGEKDIWLASFSLPDAGQCDVIKGAAGAWFYSCAAGSKTEARAASAFNESLASVASCLSSWTRQPVVNSSSPGKVLDSVAFIGADANRGFTVQLERVELDDKQDGKFWVFSMVVERRPV